MLIVEMNSQFYDMSAQTDVGTLAYMNSNLKFQSEKNHVRKSMSAMLTMTFDKLTFDI